MGVGKYLTVPRKTVGLISLGGWHGLRIAMPSGGSFGVRLPCRVTPSLILALVVLTIGTSVASGLESVPGLRGGTVGRGRRCGETGNHAYVFVIRRKEALGTYGGVGSSDVRLRAAYMFTYRTCLILIQERSNWQRD